jgi:serine/threonine protein kinase/WD40 repeat protein/Tfp pilus assembly protein PilF
MSEPSSEINPLDQLAEEFVERFRRGERPALTDYIRRCPELEAEIRDLFPGLVLIEGVRPKAGEATGAGSTWPRVGPRQPERLGDYRILREVGRGGMGVVYEAEQESLGRHVALKVMPAHLMDNPVHLERFRREARAAARLHHTNIVPVYGVGETDGVHHYAMQFIVGEGLDRVLCDLQRLRDETRPPGVDAPTATLVPPADGVARSLVTGSFTQPAMTGEAPPAVVPVKSDPAPSGSSLPGSEAGWQYYRSVARLGLQAAEALAYAHRQGVLHRDIKPSNLLLDSQGTVWITDFGLAKSEGGDLTQLGEIVGTLRYMAPERMSGKSLPQSDVYSLGLTLYELATLRPAFDDADRMAIIDRQLHEQPVPPRRLDRHIPRDLETIILKCLAKDAAERYATADALAEDLRRFLADRPIKARRAAWYERTWRWCRRNPVVAGLLGFAATLLVTIAVVSTLYSLRLSQAQVATQDELEHRIAAETEGKHRLFQSLVDQARASRYSRRVGQRFESLKALKEAARLARELALPEERITQLRNEAIACMALPDMRLIPDSNAPAVDTSSILFDSQFKYRVNIHVPDGISLRRVGPEGAALGTIPCPDAEWVIISTDSRFLYPIRRGRPAEIWDRENLSAPVFRSPQIPDKRVAFFSDSRRVVMGDLDGSITIYELPSGKVLRSFPAVSEDQEGRRAPGASEEQPSKSSFRKSEQTVHDFVMHPRAPVLATVYETSVTVRDLETGAVVREFSFPYQPWPTAHWDPTGKVLAVYGGDPAIRLWDWRTGKELDRLEGLKGGGVIFAFNPQGNLLASSGWDGRLRLWDWRLGQQVLNFPLNCSSLQFSPDGHRLALPNGNLWEVADPREYRTLTCDPSLEKQRYGSVAFGRDGRWLAVGAQDGFGLWDLVHGSPLAFIAAPWTAFVCFEPSGSLLTFGEGGLVRWPLQTVGSPPAAMRLGPPIVLSGLGALAYAGQSADGKVIAFGLLRRGAAGLLRGDGTETLRILPHGDVWAADVSPDGRWVVTGCQHGKGTRIWDARTGALVRELLADEARGGGRFSPTGEWLATGTAGRIRLWAVGSWNEGPQLGDIAGGLAFSPDGKVIALETGQGMVRLVEVATGREVARLEDPNGDRSSDMSFSPDGSQLAVTMGSDSPWIHVWDLRVLREQLVKLGLDWDQPSLPPVKPVASASIQPLQCEVDLGELEDEAVLGARPSRESLQKLVAINSVIAYFQPLNRKAYRRRARAHGMLGNAQKAIADYKMALALTPAADATRVDLLGLRAANYLDIQANELALADLRAADRIDLSRGRMLRSRLSFKLVEQAERLFRKDHAVSRQMLRLALEIDPANRNARNNLAWLLLTGPKELQDARAALTLARSAAGEDASQVSLNTLGVALCRNGQYAEAISVLDKSLAAGHGQFDAFDLYFLAICHARQGDAARARACFDRAVHWVETQGKLPADDAEELRGFREEAAEAIQASEKARKL